MDSLDQLQQNIQLLIQQQQQLLDEMLLLKQENLRQREEIIKTHADLQQLKKDYQQLQVAHAMLSENPLHEEQRQKAKQRLTAIIAQLDRAIETLKQ